jgi:Mrp family chromosome partitioning ATPase
VDEARVIMLRNEASLELLEAASPPLDPLPSGRKLVVAAGAVFGTGAGLFAALALTFFDPVVRSRKDLMYLMGSELVWEFQRIPVGQRPLIDTWAPAEPVATLFRRLVNDFDAVLEGGDWRRLAVTSIEAGAGRSLVAANLAQALALKERRVILVDADLRTTAGVRPSDLFELSHDRTGLWEMLNTGMSADTLLVPAQTGGLRVLGPGVLPAVEEKTDDELLVKLGSRQLSAIIADLEDFGDHVLYDLPPLTTQETVLEAAAAVGNLLIVVRSGQTRRAELSEIVALLKDRGINVCAALLTDVPADMLDGKPIFTGVAQGVRQSSHRASRRQPKNLELEFHDS